MMRHVVVESRARRDIDGIYRWWSDHRSVDEATDWYDGLIARMATLAEFASSHPFAREAEQTTDEVREMQYGLGRSATHRVLFRVTDAKVSVIAVRHVAQDDIDL